MTVYVMVSNDDEVATLYPFRLMRKHFKIHGKLLNRPQPQASSPDFQQMSFPSWY